MVKYKQGRPFRYLLKRAPLMFVLLNTVYLPFIICSTLTKV